MKELTIMYGYIYITTNLINNKKYIGQHKASEFDATYKGSGVALSRAIEKYGQASFVCELIESFNTREELNNAEKRYIKEYNAVANSDFYNIALGGEGGDTFSGLSFDSKERFKQQVRDRWKTDKEVLRQKISKSLSGKMKSDAHKAKLSAVAIELELHKGAKNGMYGVNRSGELAPNYGKHYYTDGKVEFLLTEDTYESEYKDKGFIKGRLQTRLDALHKGLSDRLKGNTYTRGRVRIHKDDLEKCIEPKLLEDYLSQGWLKGRRPKQID